MNSGLQKRIHAMNKLIVQQDEVIEIHCYICLVIRAAAKCQHAVMLNYVCPLLSFSYIAHLVLNSHHFSGFSVRDWKEGSYKLQLENFFAETNASVVITFVLMIHTKHWQNIF